MTRRPYADATTGAAGATVAMARATESRLRRKAVDGAGHFFDRISGV